MLAENFLLGINILCLFEQFFSFYKVFILYFYGKNHKLNNNSTIG